MTSPIAPTLGRNVLVTLRVPEVSGPNGNPEAVVHGAGVVVGIDSEDANFIHVMCGAPGQPVEVLCFFYDEDESKFGTWRWMPYQREQAKKAE